MVPRLRPQAAYEFASKRVPTRLRLPPALLASLAAAAAVALAVACSGSPSGSGDPVDPGVAQLPGDPSPTPESDPTAPAGSTVTGDAPDGDSPDDVPDPVGTEEAGVEGSAAADGNGSLAAESDAVAGSGETTEAGGDEAGDAEAGNGVAGDVESDDGAAGDVESDDGAAGDVESDGRAEVVTTPESGETNGIEVPEPDPDTPRAPLTGELTTDPTLDQRRALAVKVGNSDRRSRPQAGLAAADIVYEVLIEGGKSRFLAVFHSEMPSRVGPVRSVRTSDFDLLADLSRPYLASSGANPTVLSEIRRADRAGTIVDIGGMRTFVPYSRDPARRSPHNLYFNSESLTDSSGAALRGGSLEAPVVPLLDYGSSDPAGIAGAKGVTVTYHLATNNVVSHIWDPAVRGWVRIQDGDLMMTETDFGPKAVAPANVAVVWMAHRYAPADPESPLTVSFGTGDALVLTEGTVHEAVWERTEDRAGIRFVDTAGNPLSFSPGPTWILIANSSRRFPVTEAEVLYAYNASRLLAEAREAYEATIIP